METNVVAENPAVEAARKSLNEIYECLDGGKSFILEAGAGSGKTHSLVMALRYLIGKKGDEFVRRGKRIACITYTNVASEEITSRTDGHPAVFSATIHAFCWSLIKSFQVFLRKELPKLPKWQERLDEAGGLAGREIEYELGFASARKEYPKVSLHHDDVLLLMVGLMDQPKFRKLLVSRYPVIFIDEYQDTNRQFVSSIIDNCVRKGEGPLIGFFGDNWQQIYGEEDTCGRITDDALTKVEQKSNFRSAPPVIEVLNKMRPELPQAFSDPDAEGEVAAYHTNSWKGARRDGKGGGHWKGDLPEETAHAYLEALRRKLEADGWDMSSGQTKILMLTHGVLASEQGYRGIAKAFSGFNNSYAKKEDSLIKFLLEVVEPMAVAYEGKRFGEMFRVLGMKIPQIRRAKDKLEWARDMSTLLRLRQEATIRKVIDHLKATGRPRLPDSILQREKELREWMEAGEAEESGSKARLKQLLSINYTEVIALSQFVDEHTLFSTKHGVKGAEFENVIVVAGRGWNKYDFNKLLEYLANPGDIPADRSAYERWRNLFYVACSRPKKRLAVLFTQELSDTAIQCLSKLFGSKNVFDFSLT
ncbi:DNA helicase-2/ATP-dependent DNA helicase PcrA [Chitinivorax tropicus]|uniref:DNA helicase-2/ATP-dependent DNA helicase PcrA n=1 Tax=Chitinivorax tropicus TaxID=714531 RepID=A0A840MMB9_9PROT|nr:UvrD-helicase domain-containing protein [Chitinivorax tropicus]MBB5018077.1 DNA helicase-2/ATP-dependent DNA helicase PcrA [Chitinivorax tropicus]